MKKLLKDYYLYIVIFLVFLAIGLFVPTGGDDWEISGWYQDAGLFKLLCKSFEIWNSFNGRILNNFFDMFLSKYAVLWAFISAFIQTLTIFMSLKIIKQDKNKKNILLCLLMVLSVSISFRREVQIHKIGNISYSIPACLIFIASYLLLNKKKAYEKKDYAIIAFLTMCSCLFIENLTIALTTMSGLLLVYEFKKDKKINKYTLFALIGCLIACLILFSSPGFLNRYNSSTGGSSITELIKVTIPIVLAQITVENSIIYIIYSLVCINYLKNKKNIPLKIYFYLICVFLIITTALGCYAPYNSNVGLFYNKIYNYFLKPDCICGMIINISIIISILIMIIKYSKGKSKESLLFLFLLSLFSAAPMVIAPGSRNLILVIYSVIIITNYFYSEIEIKNYKVVKWIIISVIIFRLEDYHYILNKAHLVEIDRLNKIADYKINYSSDNNVLVLPTYDTEIIQNLNANCYDQSFKKYYMLPEDTLIVYEDEFMYKETIVNKDCIEIVLLGNGDYTYKYDVVEDGKIIYSEESDSNILNYSFESGKRYVVNTRIFRVNGSYNDRSVEVMYEE